MRPRQEINTERIEGHTIKVLPAKNLDWLFLPNTLTLQQVQMVKFLANVMEWAYMSASVLGHTETKL